MIIELIKLVVLGVTLTVFVFVSVMFAVAAVNYIKDLWRRK